MTTLDSLSADLSLIDLERCFRGAVPAVLATASADGVPNITYLSRAHQVDDHRIALSNQFMSKTSRNLATNPRACLLLIDPRTYDEYRLSLVYERTERRGPVFERLRSDIEALAVLAGMEDVFRLRSADVFRVTEIARVAPNPDSAWPNDDAVTIEADQALRETGAVVRAISRSSELDVAIDVAMDGLHRRLRYEHVYLMLVDETGERLYTIASRGYDQESLGGEIAFGEGQVGAVATRCESTWTGGLRQLSKYSRSIRRSYEAQGVRPGRDQPPPDLPTVDSRIAVPVMSGGQLLGVLVAESPLRTAFDEIDDHILGTVATVLAGAVELGRTEPAEQRAPDAAAPTATAPEATADPNTTTTSVVRYFSIDGSTFVDGEYLIKGVAGRILWSLLRQHAGSGRLEFTNRELRLDPTLDLPGFKDNLESRLLLLRRRLDERRAPFRLVPTGRGRFRLDVAARIVLERGEGPA